MSKNPQKFCDHNGTKQTFLFAIVFTKKNKEWGPVSDGEFHRCRVLGNNLFSRR